MVQVWHTLLTHYQEAEKNIFQGLVRELKKLDFSRLIPLYGITNPALPSSLFFLIFFFFAGHLKHLILFIYSNFILFYLLFYWAISIFWFYIWLFP